MGQILCRFFNFIFGSSRSGKKTYPDLEGNSTSSARDHQGARTAASLDDQSTETVPDIVVGKEVVTRTTVTLIDHPKEVENTEEEEEEEDEVKPEIKWITCYSSCQKILLVGEGDFSFSSSLATAFGSATNMVATSLDSREFLERNYGNAISNIRNLQQRGCKVIHGVDATQMASHPLIEDLKFERIIYNFPLAGFFKNQVPRQIQLLINQMLVVKFMAEAKRLIREEEGEIHITHKSNNGFFQEWDLTLLASKIGLRLLEEQRFRRADYPGYCTKYGFGGDNNFNCNPSKTYKFGVLLPAEPSAQSILLN